MGLILEQIPGYLEATEAAAAEEAAIRELPYFDQPIDICGIPVRLFTLRHWITLKTLKSPFLGGDGEFDTAAVCQFLWIVSTDFAWGDAVARDSFFRRIFAPPSPPFAELVRGISSYIDDAMMDLRSRSGDRREPPVTSFVSSIVHRIASAYGIGSSGLRAFRNELLDMPIIELAQYRREILMDMGARFVSARASRIQRQIVAKALEERRREAEKKTESPKKAALNGRKLRKGKS